MNPCLRNVGGIRVQNSRQYRRRIQVFAGTRACLFAILACLSFNPPAQATPADGHRAHFDALFAALMEEHQIPGLAVVLVQDRRVVFEAGYGWADVARRQPVDPDRTVFPLGSISKLLTTVAVLQLVEQGSLDLDTDIERYIAPLDVDDRFTAPVTLRHVLTHTDGFDVRWLFGGAARVPEDVRSLRHFLAELPPRVMPAGETYLYGDVGMTVAGYAVENASGLPFAAYMEQHVFAPLGMSSASFRPDRKFYARDRATGYEYDHRGRFHPVPVVYPHATPASGLTAPISDMGPLMLALLSGEAQDAPRVLGDHSLHELWRKQFSHHAALPGTGLGVYEFVHQGRRALVHGGLLPGFTSVMAFLPDAGVGLCVAANRFDLIEPLETVLLRNLLDRFSPAPTAKPPLPRIDRETVPRPPGRADAGQFAGVYRCDQYSRFSSDKLFVFAGLASEIRVIPQSDGALQLLPGAGRWQEIGPLVFENDLSGERIVFRTDANGVPTQIVGSAQLMSYHRVGPRENRLLHAGFGGLLFLISATAGLCAARAGWRSLAAPVLFQRKSATALRSLAIALPVSGSILVIGLFTALRDLDFATAAFGEPASVAFFRGFPWAIVLLALALFVVSIVSIRARSVSRGEALVYAAAALASLLLVLLLAEWQLVRAPLVVLASFLP